MMEKVTAYSSGMNKYLVGGILAAIALMVIYGTTASSRVASWMDGENPTAAGQDGQDDSRVAINPDGATGDAQSGSFLTSDQTPVQQAGQLPQRQTASESDPFTTAQTDFGDDTTASDTETPIDPPAPNPPATPQQTTPAASEPIRALW